MSTDPVDSALAELATFAVARLASEMRSAKASKDRIAAANSILDRLGYGRATRAQADVADNEIRKALDAVLQDVDKTNEIESHRAISDLIYPQDDDDDDDEQDRKEQGNDGEETESWVIHE